MPEIVLPQTHDVSPLEHSKISPEVLGLQVVIDTETRVANLIAGDQLKAIAAGIDASTIRGKHEQEWMLQDARHAEGLAEKHFVPKIEEALTEIRDELDLLEDSFKTSLSCVIDEHAPSFIRQRYEAWSKPHTPRKLQRFLGSVASKLTLRKRPDQETALADKSWVKWLSEEATDDELINFLQWHTSRIEALQADPEIKGLIDQEREIYKTSLVKGIENGYLHPNAKYMIDQVDDIPIIMTDYFDSARMGGAAGYADTQGTSFKGASRGAYITEAYDPTDLTPIADKIQTTVTHELNHFMGDYGPKWVNEALTEHIAQSMNQGSWELVDPLDRHDDGSYAEFRYLLSVVLDIWDGHSPHLPLLKALTQAYSAPRKNDIITSSSKIFTVVENAEHKRTRSIAEDYLEQMYGSKHVFEAIDKRMKEYIAEMEHADGLDYIFENQNLAADRLAEEWLNPKHRKEIIEDYESQWAIDNDQLDEAWI